MSFSLYDTLWSIPSRKHRDILWLLHHPNLLENIPDLDCVSTEDKRQWLEHSLPWLVENAKYPEILESSLQGTRQHKLGVYAENLLLYYLRWSSPFRLIEHDLQIFTEKTVEQPNKRSIGALDFLIETPNTEIEHWEMTIKYYLHHHLHPHLPINHPAQYIGPDGKDSLHNKLEKLRSHQLPLGSNPRSLQTFAEMGIQAPIRSRLFHTGMFFAQWQKKFPIPEHCSSLQPTGTWIHKKDFIMQFHSSSKRWAVRTHPNWLAPILSPQGENIVDAIEVMEHPMDWQKFIMVAEMQRCPKGWQEVHRWVLVEDDWVQ